jgi:DNA-binding HxlR family transcriptional regulator
MPFGCPLTGAMEVLGGKWRIPILWHLQGGALRYGELRRKIPEASERMITRALRDLEASGLVVRTAYPEVPPRVEYALADAARSLIPVLNRLGEWSAQHLHAPAE